MTKKIIRGLEVCVLIMVTLLITLSINASINAYDKEHNTNYRYHFQVILDKDMDIANRGKLVEGIYKAAQEERVFIELVEAIDSSNKEELLDKAIYSRVEGIAYSATSKKVANTLGNKADAVDIPMVNYGLTADSFDNVFSIHDSPNNIASSMANNVNRLIKGKKFNKKGQILVFLKECDSRDVHNNDKFVDGFSKEIDAKYKQFVKFIRVDAKGYDVNSKLKSQIKNNKQAKVIVCFDKEYTNVASSLYNGGSNKRRPVIVGYEDTINNIKALQDKNIDLLVNVKKSSIGYNLVKALCSLQKESKINKSKYVPVFQVIQLDSSNKVKYQDFVVSNK